jgi:hypothetical protein
MKTVDRSNVEGTTETSELYLGNIDIEIVLSDDVGV